MHSVTTKKSSQTSSVVTVLGSGSWGTALAAVLAHHADDVRLWGRDAAVAESVNARHENSHYLPGLKLSPSIHATLSLEEALKNTSLVLCGLPTKAIESVLRPNRNLISENIPVVSAAKGLCTTTLRFPSRIIQESLGRKNLDQVFILSGPSFAKETAQQLPTAVTLAGTRMDQAEAVGQRFFTPFFRTYPSTDPVGVEVAGALKNSVAIAAGITDGLKLGWNTQAALITRGLAEITRMGVSLGAQPLTFLGLAGMGDLVLTCTGSLSRNRTVGVHLAQGKTLDEALEAIGQVAEGVATTRSVHELIQKKMPELEMPILTEVHHILFENKPVRQALNDLMSRPMRSEHHGTERTTR